jgi:hypothetical protein
MSECIMKKPLAALALAGVAVASLAVPAGASTRTTWTHQTLTCQGGRHATVTWKWQGGYAVNTWVDNSCRHQYVSVGSCDPTDLDSPKCFETDVAPATKRNLGWQNARVDASLNAQPLCAEVGGDEPCEW